MNISEHTKRATSLAKEGKFDEAISLLQKLVPEMAQVGGFGNGGYTKIIPYYQKAGRYHEGVDYSVSTLMPAVKKDCSTVFSHKCNEIQQAFIQLGISQIYEKLRLCAKREKKKEDEALYAKLSEDAWQEYERFLSAGERIELKKDFEEVVKIYGPATENWPEAIKGRFSAFINP